MPRDRSKPVRRLTDDEELFFADGSMLVARRLYADGVSHMETATEVAKRLFGDLETMRALYAERSEEIERLPRMAHGPATRSYGYWACDWGFPPDQAEEIYHDIAEQRRWLDKAGLIDEQEQAAIDREQQQAQAQKDFGRKKKG